MSSSDCRIGREGKATGESRLFRITDLGLTYKLGNQGLLLWVTSVSWIPWPGYRSWALPGTWRSFPWVRPTRKESSLLVAGNWKA